MTRDEVFERVRGVLVDALAVDEDEVSEDSRLIADLGAESIDILDISFKLEQAFGFKIAQGELFPEGVTQNPEYVQGGRVTDKGLEELREKLPHFDFSELARDRSVQNVANVFTVGALVGFCERKLGRA